MKTIGNTFTIALLVVLGVATLGTSAYGFAGGDGTSGNPYQIENCTDLQNINNDLSAYYILVNDIDCTSFSNFNPIGGLATPFEGSLDGQHYAINNLDITDNSLSDVGIFRVLENAEISNLRIHSGSITQLASGYVGTLAGDVINTEISAIVITDEVLTGPYVGGLAGVLDGNGNTINVNNVSVSATITASGIAGGIAGIAQGGVTIEDVYTEGTITQMSGSGNTGGIVGATYAPSSVSPTIRRVYSNVAISASNTAVGGLIGQTVDTTLTNSFSVSPMTGVPAFSGSIIGWAGSASGFSGLSYNSDLTNNSSCVYGGPGSSTCTDVSGNNSYFNDASNAPMSTWDFSNVWYERTDDLPVLRYVPYYVDTPTISTTSAPTSLTITWPVLDVSFPSAPSYDIEYRIQGSNGSYTSVASSDLTETINSLSPSTTYEFRLRGTNAEGNGPWTFFNATTSVPAQTNLTETIPALGATIAATGTLPATGSNPTELLVIATVLLAVGIATEWFAGRRKV